MAQPVVTHRAIQRGVTESNNRVTLRISQDPSDAEHADNHSVHHLVNHVRSRSVNLVALGNVRFSEEGFAVLQQYFASNTTAPLTTISVNGCHFPRQDGASQLLSAFQTNLSVTHLNISRPQYQGAILFDGSPLNSDVIAGLLTNNNSHMRTLNLHGFAVRLGDDVLLCRALGNIPHLTELCLSSCWMGDPHLQVITDGLVGDPASGGVGNATLKILDISMNRFTPDTALSNMARLLGATHLQEISCTSMIGATINDGATVQRFSLALSINTTLTTLDMRGIVVSSSAAGIIFQGLVGNTTLESLVLGHMEPGNLQLVMASIPLMRGVKQLTLGDADAWNLLLEHQSLLPSLHQNTSFETFPGLELRYYPRFAAVIPKINVILTRNCSMKRVALLLQPLPRTRAMIPENNLAWRRAILRLACDPDGSGTSAIFQLLQNHPAILEVISPPAPQRGR